MQKYSSTEFYKSFIVKSNFFMCTESNQLIDINTEQYPSILYLSMHIYIV